MKVCAVILTYDDRWKFVKKAIEACSREKVDKIIVVDNASSGLSKQQLISMTKKLRGKLKVINLLENYGSAGGYKQGLMEAYKCEDCDFIWLFDDDLKPARGALKVLKQFWRRLDIVDKERNVCLLAYRKIFNVYENGQNISFLIRKNAFLEFHIKDLPYKILRRVSKGKIFVQGKQSKNFKNYLVLPVATWGGLFFNKHLLDNIGYPDERFFFYVGDYEFTYRLTKKNGKIFVIFNSLIEDIEPSAPATKNRISFFELLDNESDFRIYYKIRNKVYFENKYLITARWIYNINKWVYLGILKIISLITKRNNRFRLIYMAVKDGECGKLGKKPVLAP